MSEGSNMICPACGTFQPRAEVCKKCGIIIAKASHVAKLSAPSAVTTSSSKPPVAMIILAAVIAVPVIGYFLFSGANNVDSPTAGAEESVQPEQAGAKSQIDRIASVNPAVANNLQRSQVQSKLHELRTMLNVYLVENELPPSNEEGLQALVDKGVVTVSDITDEWGNRFEYRLEWGKETALEREYKIYISSKGPDGVSRTADDIGT